MLWVDRYRPRTLSSNFVNFVVVWEGIEHARFNIVGDWCQFAVAGLGSKCL